MFCLADEEFIKKWKSLSSSNILHPIKWSKMYRLLPKNKQEAGCLDAMGIKIWRPIGWHGFTTYEWAGNKTWRFKRRELQRSKRLFHSGSCRYWWSNFSSWDHPLFVLNTEKHYRSAWGNANKTINLLWTFY